MKVLLLNPPRKHIYNPAIRPFTEFTYAKISEDKRTYFLPPLEFTYIASLLEKNGHKVSFIDMNLEANPSKEVESIIIDERPHIVITTSSPRHEWRCPVVSTAHVTSITKLIKNIDNSIMTAIIGVHGTYEPLQLLKKPYIDYVIRGEPEYACLELINILSGKGGNTRGICYKDRDGKLYINHTSSIPFDFKINPDYDILDIERYAKIAEKYSLKGTFMLIEASRGCPYNCTFCLKLMFKNGAYRAKPISTIIKEIKLLSRRGVEAICFVDETFTLDNGRTRILLEKLLEERIQINWWCQTRPDRISGALLPMMKRAGCREIDFGVESLNQSVLKRLNKNMNPRRILKILKYTKKHDIIPKAFMLLFAPGDTVESMIKSILQIAKLRITCYASITIPYPTTDIWYEGIKEGKITEGSWEEAIKVAGTIGTRYSRQDVMRLVPKIWNEVNKILKEESGINGLKKETENHELL